MQAGAAACRSQCPAVRTVVGPMSAPLQPVAMKPTELQGERWSARPPLPTLTRSSLPKISSRRRLVAGGLRWAGGTKPGTLAAAAPLAGGGGTKPRNSEPCLVMRVAKGRPAALTLQGRIGGEGGLGRCVLSEWHGARMRTLAVVRPSPPPPRPAPAPGAPGRGGALRAVHKLEGLDAPLGHLHSGHKSVALLAVFAHLSGGHHGLSVDMVGHEGGGVGRGRRGRAVGGACAGRKGARGRSGEGQARASEAQPALHVPLLQSGQPSGAHPRRGRRALSSGPGTARRSG